MPTNAPVKFGDVAGPASSETMLASPATRGATTIPARGRGAARGAARGLAAPPTPQQLAAQADAYAKLFEVFLKHRDAIDRVTFWGLNDARSWRREQAPLLLDGENQPKPAMAAVLDAKN
jgi:hypothetical protein